MATQRLDVNEAVARLDVYRRQAEAAQRHLELLEGVLRETQGALRTLDEWKDRSPGDELLMPVGANTYVAAQVGDASNVVVGVGSGISAQRTTAQAVATLERRAKEVEAELDRTAKAAVELQQQALQLQDAIESAMGQAPEGGAQG